MTSTRKLTDAVELLLSILQRDLDSPNDMVSLILTGEVVVRLTNEARKDMEFLEEAHWLPYVLGADAALKIYFRTLTKNRKFIPIDLDADLEKGLKVLSDWHQNPSGERDDVLRNIDGVLMIASAAHRVGRVKLSYVQKLARRARNVSRDVGYLVVDLWNEAERRMLLGEDPDHPFITEWLEPMAQHSSSRLSIALMVSSPSTRKVLIETDRVLRESSKLLRKK